MHSDALIGTVRISLAADILTRRVSEGLGKRLRPSSLTRWVIRAMFRSRSQSDIGLFPMPRRRSFHRIMAERGSGELPHERRVFLRSNAGVEDIQDLPHVAGEQCVGVQPEAGKD